uniref:Uncharacterized protein n=1 Tax=Rhizophora mucronata TaxID=61149 RepID=A0A2P2NYG6_RHIMU
MGSLSSVSCFQRKAFFFFFQILFSSAFPIYVGMEYR